MAKSFEWHFDDFMNKLEAFSLSSQFSSKDAMAFDSDDSGKVSLKMIQEFLSKERNTVSSATSNATSTLSPRSSSGATGGSHVKKPQIMSNRPLPS